MYPTDNEIHHKTFFTSKFIFLCWSSFLRKNDLEIIFSTTLFWFQPNSVFFFLSLRNEEAIQRNHCKKKTCTFSGWGMKYIISKLSGRCPMLYLQERKISEIVKEQVFVHYPIFQIYTANVHTKGPKNSTIKNNHLITESTPSPSIC